MKNWRELLVLSIILFISVIFRGSNMFQYPAYFDDEGTYMAQAWAFLTSGELSHYTYWYDHPPVGWIQLAVWALISGGFDTFGFALNSGRLYMLLLSIGNIFFIYKICRNFNIDKIPTIIGTLIFVISPLAIAMNRMVFLDNIMIFWVLFSIWLMSLKKIYLLHIILCAITYGVAILSKEIAIFFLPVFVWFIFVNSNKSQRIFSVILFILIVSSIGSSWILYAALKNELVPVGWLNSNPEISHVSLITTIEQQLSRDGHGSIFTPGSDIQTSIYRWMTGNLSLFEGVSDVILLSFGLISVVVNTLFGILSKNRRYIFVALLAASYILFLTRGGIVLVFYIIGLLPIFALNISFTIHLLFKCLKLIKSRALYIFGILLILAAIISSYIYFNFQNLKIVLFSNQTSANIKAVEWVESNTTSSQNVLVDDYAYIDLKGNKNPIYYWKTQDDPEVNKNILKNDWRNIDYLLTTPSFRSDINSDRTALPLVRQAYKHSTKVATFDGDNYYKVEIYRVNNDKNNDDLIRTWKYYTNNFVDINGRVIDPSNGKTTSEGQSYALLRAVWVDDQETFEKVLSWTKNNILLDDKNLFAWWYGKNDKGQVGIVDKGNATDADQDIALALLLASKRWDKDEYRILAEQIISDIWKYETVEVKGKRYIVAGDWAANTKSSVYTVNPSYLSPYAYRIFAEVDNKHDWMSIVDTSYEVLDKCSSSKLNVWNSTYLPPDWCNITKNGAIVESKNMSGNSANYSYDALRIPWRIGLDYVWNKEERAKEYLEKITLFRKEWEENNKINSSYAHSGKAIDDTEALSQYAGQLAYFTILDKDIAEDLYDNKILPNLKKNDKKHYWGDPNNYYDQNWVWFSTALYKNRLPNLWTAN